MRQTAFHDPADLGGVPARGGRRYMTKRSERRNLSILWIILIVVLVLAVLGFFGRGRL
jgi:hypothetical protein